MSRRARSHSLRLAGAALALASGLAAAATPAGGAGAKAFASVDPYIGTGGEGHTVPGATVPM